MKISEESLRKVPKEDVSAIESIIYNEKTDEFTYEEVIEEEPHMAAWRSAKEKDRRKIVSVYSVCNKEILNPLQILLQLVLSLRRLIHLTS